MPCKLDCKPGVKWEVVPAIEAAQDVIASVYASAKAKATICSAHDSKHSLNSAHHQNDPKALSNAVDLRIMNLFRNVPLHDGTGWFSLVLGFARILATALDEHLQATQAAGQFYVVFEVDHLHVEWSKDHPNIVGYIPGQRVYTTKKVDGYLA